MGLEARVGKRGSKQGDKGISDMITSSGGKFPSDRIGEPSALYFEKTTSNSADVRFEFWRVVNEFDYIGFEVAYSLPYSSEVDIAGVIIPNDPLVVDGIFVNSQKVPFID